MRQKHHQSNTAFLTKYAKPLTSHRLVIVIVVFVALFASAFFNASVRHAAALATSHRPETFTELYFNQPNKLPVDSPAKVIRNCSFGITNHEAATKDYLYTAYFLDTTTGKTTQLLHSTISLRDGESTTIKLHFAFPTSGHTYVVGVILDGRTEQIQFRSRT